MMGMIRGVVRVVSVKEESVLRRTRLMLLGLLLLVAVGGYAQPAVRVPLVLGRTVEEAAKDGTSWKAILDDDPQSFVLMGGGHIEVTLGLENGPEVLSALQLRIQPLGFKGHIAPPSRFQLFVSQPSSPDDFQLVLWDSIPDPDNQGGEWIRTFQFLPVLAESLKLVFASPPEGQYVTRYFLNDVFAVVCKEPSLFRKNMSWGIIRVPYEDTLTVVGLDSLRSLSVTGLPPGLGVGSPSRVGWHALWRIPVLGTPELPGKYRPSLHVVDKLGHERILTAELSIADSPELFLFASDGRLTIWDRKSNKSKRIPIESNKPKKVVVAPGFSKAVVVGEKGLSVVDLHHKSKVQHIPLKDAGDCLMLEGGQKLVCCTRGSDSIRVLEWNGHGYEKLLADRLGDGRVPGEIERIYSSPDRRSFWIWKELKNDTTGSTTELLRVALVNDAVFEYEVAFRARGLNPRTLVPTELGILYAPKGSELHLVNGDSSRRIAVIPDSLGFCGSVYIDSSGSYAIFLLRKWVNTGGMVGWFPSKKVAVWNAASPDTLFLVDFNSTAKSVNSTDLGDSVLVLTENHVYLFSPLEMSKRVLPLRVRGERSVAELSLRPAMVDLSIYSAGASARLGHASLFLDVMNPDSLYALRVGLKTLPQWLDLSNAVTTVNEQRVQRNSLELLELDSSEGTHVVTLLPSDTKPLRRCIAPIGNGNVGEKALLVFDVPTSYSLPYTGKMLLGLDDLELVDLGSDDSTSWGSREVVPYRVSEYWLSMPSLPAGDVNADGELTLLDLLEVMDLAANEQAEVPLRTLRMSDVNFDGEVDLRDVQVLKKWVLRGISLIPHSTPKRSPRGRGNKEVLLTLTGTEPIEVGLVRFSVDPVAGKLAAIEDPSLGRSGKMLMRWIDLGGGRYGIVFASLADRVGLPQIRFRLKLRSDSKSSELIENVAVDGVSGVDYRGQIVQFGAEIQDASLYEAEHQQGYSIPEKLALSAYPNPFNGKVAIQAEIPKNGKLRVTIYDVLGRTITTLHDKRVEAGVYRWVWDARSAAGMELPSGLYFCRLEMDGRVLTRKLLLIE